MNKNSWPEIEYQDFKMIVSDLDGTLKDVNSPIDPALPKIIDQLNQRGVLFTLATGKNLKSTRTSAGYLGIQHPLILSNGCVLQTLEGTVLEKNILPPLFAAALIEICSKEKIDLAILIDEEIYVRKITHHASILFDYGSPNLVEVGEWSSIDHILSRAHKCIAIERDDRDRLLHLEKIIFSELGSVVEYCHTLVEMLEFMPRGISKVSGIRSLAKRSGISLDSVFTMGDGNNDIGMLMEAGSSAAVANAPQAVCDAADWIIPSCAQNGPRDFLSFFLNNI